MSCINKDSAIKKDRTMSSRKKHSGSYTLTKQELDAFLQSHKNLHDFINLANSLRKNGKAKDMNFFKQFFMNAEKFL